MKRIIQAALAGVALLLALSLPKQAAAQDIEIDFVSSTLWTSIQDVKVVGDYAYCVFSCGFMIIDISDPTEPVWVSQLPLQSGSAIDVLGDYVFVADYSRGLIIIDISNPVDPAYLGNVDEPDFATDVFVTDSYAYLTDGEFGLYIVDYSNPSQPVVEGQCQLYGQSDAVYVDGDYAYIANREAGLQIIDVSVPSSPGYVTNFSTDDMGLGVCVADNYAYLAVRRDGLFIIDVNDPFNPQFEGSCEMDGAAVAVIVDGDYAYIANGDGGLQIVDISLPSMPSVVGSYETEDNGIGLSKNGEILFLADYSSLEIFDVSDQEDPIIIGTYDIPDQVRRVFIQGDYAYVNESHGFWVVDISDPAKPMVMGHCDTPGISDNLYISGNYAYVSNWQYGLQIMDISDPANPFIAGNYPTNDRVYDVFVVGDYAYLSDEWLIIIDISDPTDPVFYSLVDLPYSQVGPVYVSGNYAYVTNIPDGMLYVIDISALYDPRVIGGAPIDAYPTDIGYSDGYVYVAAEDGYFKIFDVSDPVYPTLVCSYEDSYPGRFEIYGNYAFLTWDIWQNLTGLEILDISDPTAPISVYSYQTQDPALDISIDDNFIYVAGINSLQVLHFDFTDIDLISPLPGSCSLLQNYPNPFNASTSISYELPVESDVTIDIYDILGRRIETLISQNQPAGVYSLIWHAEDLPSGVYFYKLQAGDFMASQRCLLLK